MERIIKLLELEDLDIPNGSKSRRFKINYKLLLKEIFDGTMYEIEGFKTTKKTLSCYIKDKYTGRLMYIMVPDITVDSDAWMNNIQYKTASKLYEIPNSIDNYCSLNKIIPSLNALNVFYKSGFNMMRA